MMAFFTLGYMILYSTQGCMIFHRDLYFVPKYFKVVLNHHCRPRVQIAITVAVCVSQHKKGSILELTAKHKILLKNLD